MTVLRWRRVLLTVHLLGGVGLFGTDVVVLVLTASGLAGVAPETIYPAAERIGLLVMDPLAAIALATGAALVVGHRRWSTPWVLAKLAITVVLAGALFLVLVPRLSSAAGLASRHDLISAGRVLVLVIAPAIAATLLAVNAVLGVIKPPRRRRSPDALPKPR